MAQSIWVLTDSAQGIHEPEFQTPGPQKDEDSPAYSIRRQTLQGGVREGVDTIVVDNGKLRFTVVPTRGMGLWKAKLGKIPFGWKSPVKGPVHPNFVPVSEPSGLGWLEGFDELLCRCGLVSNGAPAFGPNGVLQYPLHGRIANLPAHRVEVMTDDSTGELSVSGLVDETRFLFQKLQLKSTYKTKVGQNGLTIVDEVTNLSGEPAEAQLLYHINFGPPVLDAGAKVVAPVKTIVPRNARAAEGIANWESYAAPQAGFTEQVYFFRPGERRGRQDLRRAQECPRHRGGEPAVQHQAVAVLYALEEHATRSQRLCDGTGARHQLPQPASVRGRTRPRGEARSRASAKFELELEFLSDEASVAAAEQKVIALQGGAKPQVFNTPQPGWTKV